MVVTVPLAANAHGIGGRQDLPVPLKYFVVGAGTVLVLSFIALATLWPKPRWQGDPAGRALPGRWVTPLRLVGGTAGVTALLAVVGAGLAGVDNPARNPAPVLVFVVFWLVVPFLSGVVGDIYPLVDPWRRLARWFRLGQSGPNDHSRGLGYFPAAAVFVGFTWLELVSPDSGPRVLAIAALVYTAYLLAGSELLGRTTATVSLDGFAVYNRLLGAMGPLDLHSDPPRWRGWLRGLANLSELPGLTLMLTAMIGTVTYDGVSGTVWWEEAVASPLSRPLTEGLGWSPATAGAVAGTVGLVAVTAVIGAAYLAAAAVAARIAGDEGTTAVAVARRFAHSLVPIAFAYAFAHYFTLVLYEGQYLLSTISDPFGRGWDLFGTAGRPVDYTVLAPAAVWWIQVAVIVAGHVAGVVLAHDRALTDFSPLAALRSQYAMLGLMVILTGLGLTILAAG